MPLVFVEGFEDLSAWTLGGSPTVVAGRNGNALQISSTSHNVTMIVPSAWEHATWTFGFAIKMTATPAAQPVLFTLGSDGYTTQHLTFECSNSFGLIVSRAGVSIASSPAFFSLSNWIYMEVQVTLGDAGVGSLTVRKNGTTVIGPTTLDTKNAGTKTVFDAWRFWASATNGYYLLDDLYLQTGNGDSFLGDTAVETLYPDGAGTNTNFTPSTGSNWDCVNESGTPSTTDYVSSSTSGHRDEYTYQNLVRTSGSVLGVCHVSYMSNSDAGARQVRQSVRTSSLADSASPIDLDTTWKNYYQAYSTDPAGGSWDITKVNAIQAGVKVE